MLAYRVVCCSYQSDCCVRVCFLHQQIATLGYVSHQSLTGFEYACHFLVNNLHFITYSKHMVQSC